MPDVSVIPVAADIDGTRERCAVDPATFAVLGVNPGGHDFTRAGHRPQLRLTVPPPSPADPPKHYALYTVVRLDGSAGSSVVQLGPAALRRLFDPDPSPGTAFQAIVVSGDVTLQPGQEHRYQKDRSFSRPGAHAAWPVVQVNGRWVEIDPNAGISFTVRP